MQLPVFLVVLVVLGVRAEEGDDCDQHGLPLHAPDCCPKVETLLSETILEAKQACLTKFPIPVHGFPALVPGLALPPPPPGMPELPLPPPPPTMVPAPPPPELLKEVMKQFSCASECVFNEMKLLDDDKKILGDAVTAALTASVDEELAETTSAAVKHCLEHLEDDSSSSEEDTSSSEEGTSSSEEDTSSSEECTSAPRKLMMCIARQLVLTCPESLATGPMCEEAREKLGKCPNTPVFLHAPPPKGMPPIPALAAVPPSDLPTELPADV